MKKRLTVRSTRLPFCFCFFFWIKNQFGNERFWGAKFDKNSDEFNGVGNWFGFRRWRLNADIKRFHKIKASVTIDWKQRKKSLEIRDSVCRFVRPFLCNPFVMAKGKLKSPLIAYRFFRSGNFVAGKFFGEIPTFDVSLTQTPRGASRPSLPLIG